MPLMIPTMKQSCIPTGIPALDSAMSGGISAGESILLITENSIDAARLMQTVLLNLIREKKKALYISSKKSVATLAFELKGRGDVPDEIDSYIFDAGVPDENTFFPLLDKITASPAGCCVFLDSLTSYVPFAEDNFALFMQRVNKAMREFAEKSIACIFLVSAGAFTKEHEVCFADLFSHVWRLTQESSEQKTIRVLSIESISQDAVLSPREALQLSASLSPDGTVALSYLRKIR